MSLKDAVYEILSDPMDLPGEFLDYMVQYQAQNPVSPGSLIAPSLTSSGFIGSTQKCRLVGSTTSGAPIRGTYQAGDFVVDQTGVIWVCTASGSPGTWSSANAPVVSVFGRLGVISPVSGDYTAAQVTNAADKSSSSDQTFKGGIGYATGAGGTVTQSTSKTTTVTLNTICGQIVTANSALGAGATATFTLQNSTLHSSDVVHVATVGAIGTSYTASVSGVDSGLPAGVNINLTNTTAGSLSQAVAINFVVIRGATS